MIRRQQRRNSTMTGSVTGRSTAVKSRTISGDELEGRPTPKASNDASSSSSESIQVCVRVRPLMYHEQGTAQCVDVVKDVYTDHPCIIKIVDGAKPQQFTFDEAFPVSTTQKQVFQRRVTPLIDRCLDGYNATVLAYGQTGAGKTHTVMGPAMEMDEESAGVIPRAITKIFKDLNAMKGGSGTDATKAFDYEVRVQFLEIYGEEIRDLLAVGKGEKLTIRDAGMDEPEVLGAAQHKVESAEEALSTLSRGMMRRVTASTEMNASSSRSHAIMALIIDQTTTAGDQEPESKRSKFNFVDLAGAERQKRTKATGQRLKEGVDINKGLLVLGNVISALGDPKKKKSFVPYRDSKLTRLLKGSLGGNHKSLMIACVSPSDKNAAESLNCLRYANRAKNIKNKAVQNVDPKSKLVAKLKSQMAILANDLLLMYKGGASSSGSFTSEALHALTKGEDVPTPDRSKTSVSSSDIVADASTAHVISPSAYQVDSSNAAMLLRDEIAMLRAQLAEKEEREKVVLEQTTAYLEEINRLQEMVTSSGGGGGGISEKPTVSSDKQGTAINPTISIDIPIDRMNADENNNAQVNNPAAAAGAKQEIMSASTDVCGCVFLTVSTPDGGVKLVKDTSKCVKNHNGGDAKHEESAIQGWFQKWRS